MLIERNRRPEEMQSAVMFVKDIFLPVEVDCIIELVLYGQRIMFPVDGVEDAGHNGQKGASFPSLRFEVQVLEMIENRFAVRDMELFGRRDFPRSPVPVRLENLDPRGST